MVWVSQQRHEDGVMKLPGRRSARPYVSTPSEKMTFRLAIPEVACEGMNVPLACVFPLESCTSTGRGGGRGCRYTFVYSYFLRGLQAERKTDGCSALSSDAERKDDPQTSTDTRGLLSLV